MTRTPSRPVLGVAVALVVLAAAGTAVALRGSLAALPGVGAWLQADVPPAEVWVCPMHPDVRSPQPGRCPQCGMTLVLEEPDTEATTHTSAHGTYALAASPPVPGATTPAAAPDARAPVTLDGRRQQLMGVRTVPVTRRSLTPGVRATGLVVADETRLTDVTMKIDGWIEQLHVDYTGRTVRRGEPLFMLYSPEVVAAQEEYLLAIEARGRFASSQVADAGPIAARLVEAARERLRAWDLPDAHLEQLERGGAVARTIEFPSPASGVVLEKMAVEGMRVTAGMTLFRLLDLSRVWVEADVYEGELSLLTTGTEARMHIDAFPGEPFSARLAFVSPTVDQATRTVRARFELPNPGGRLRPGMFAAVDVTGRAREALTIPADALIQTGRRTIVFLSEGDGYYTPRDVHIGARVDGQVEILDGLLEGDRVASAALFFLDSESQIRAALEGYAPSLGEPAGGAAAMAGLQIDVASEPSPPRAGPTTFVVSVRDEGGAPVTDADVTLRLFMPPMPSMNMPAMRSEGTLSHTGAGQYRGTLDVLMSGRWDATVTVARDGARLGTRQTTMVAR